MSSKTARVAQKWLAVLTDARFGGFGMRISQVTRRDIIDALAAEKVCWSGRLEEPEFLSRLFDLSAMPSTDRLSRISVKGPPFLPGKTRGLFAFFLFARSRAIQSASTAGSHGGIDSRMFTERKIPYTSRPCLPRRPNVHRYGSGQGRRYAGRTVTLTRGAPVSRPGAMLRVIRSGGIPHSLVRTPMTAFALSPARATDFLVRDPSPG